MSLSRSQSEPSITSQDSFQSLPESFDEETCSAATRETSAVAAPCPSRKDSGYAENPGKRGYDIPFANQVSVSLELQERAAIDQSSLDERGYATVIHSRSRTNHPHTKTSRDNLFKNSKEHCDSTLPWRGSRERALRHASCQSCIFNKQRPRIGRAATSQSTTNLEDLVALHQRATTIMSALEHTNNLAPASTTASRLACRYPCFTSFPSVSSSLHASGTSNFKAESLVEQQSYICARTLQRFLHSPVLTTDWLDPSTRRLAYEKHDRSRSGIRGAVRKIMPRWLRSTNDVEFYKGGDDGQSVRRHRLDLGRDARVADSEQMRGSEPGRRPLEAKDSGKNQKPGLGYGGKRRQWICFGRAYRAFGARGVKSFGGAQNR